MTSRLTDYMPNRGLPLGEFGKDNALKLNLDEMD